MRNQIRLGPWELVLCLGLALAVGLVGVPWATAPGPAVAQEAEKGDKAKAEKAEPEEQPVADEPVETEPAPRKAAAVAPEEETPPPQKSLLIWTYEALGWAYSIAFLALSFWFVALLVMNILALRRDSVVPMSLVESFEAHLNAKEYQAAYDLAKKDESFLGQVLSAGLAKLSKGYPQAIEAMQETGEEENMKLEHRLSYIALIGVISPMVGLLGTVHGMVQSFGVIANSTTQPKPAQLAQGIMMALVTTLVGLMLAIPAISVHYVLRNRIARLVLEVGILSEDLMSRFSNVGKKEQ